MAKCNFVPLNVHEFTESSQVFYHLVPQVHLVLLQLLSTNFTEKRATTITYTAIFGLYVFHVISYFYEENKTNKTYMVICLSY